MKASVLASRAVETLNSGLMVTQPEPAQRSRSYRELILQEMNWMACDYYHERRWKEHSSRQICIGIKEAIVEKKRMNKNWVANECSVNMKRFWSGIISSNMDSSLISSDLAHYCKLVGEQYRNQLQTETGDLSNDYYIGERDLIAVTVPAPVPHPHTEVQPITNAKAPVKTNDVLDVTLLSMQSMGAELYGPIFRPPDDDMDMFTMPLMDPVRDDDFNALLVQHFCLKHNDQVISVSQGKPAEDVTPSSAISRKFNRQGNEPSCLAMSVRDFDLQVKPKPTFKGVMIKTNLTSIDFELLDAWMFSENPSWPMLAICLSYRSGASGLHRFEYTADYCKQVFDSFKKQPRGLVNSSRRLLGPRQRNAITTFLDYPMPKHKYRPVAEYTEVNASAELNAGHQLVRCSVRKPGKLVISSANSELGDTASAKRRGSLRAGFLLFKRKSQNRGAGGDMDSSKEVDCEDSVMGDEERENMEVDGGIDMGDSDDVDVKMSVDKSDVELQLPFSDSIYKNTGNLPITLLQRKEKSNIIGIIKQTLSRQKSTKLEEVPMSEAKGTVIALPQNALVEVDMTLGGHSRTFWKSDRTTDPVLQIPNMSYGEYSNRMSKQLRVGFLGIPAKMFAHSLFYSGRFCKNNRVRRVAVTISNAMKVIMPQTNMLYARLFEDNSAGVFGRFRHHSWQKMPEHTPDQHAEQLMKRYTGEVMVNSPSKKVKPHASAEAQVIETLAGFVNLKLSRGEVKPQGSISHDKIPIKHLEQVTPSSQFAMLQDEPPKEQQAPVAAPAIAGVPQAAGQPIVPHSSAMQSALVQQAAIPMGQQPIMPSPMQMQQMALHSMQQQHQLSHSQMAGQMHHGQLTPGTMTPNQIPHGQMTPGSVHPLQATSGSMMPNQMPHMKLPTSQVNPGGMPGLHVSQMQGKSPGIQLQMEQMKRLHPMDMAGNRRGMIPYDQMYYPQVAMPQYRYRPVPDANMMRVPMYPMALYNKQVPYPKAQDDQYRPQHMPR